MLGDSWNESKHLENMNLLMINTPYNYPVRGYAHVWGKQKKRCKKTHFLSIGCMCTGVGEFESLKSNNASEKRFTKR